MPRENRLTHPQKSALQDIADGHLYAPDRDLRAVYDTRSEDVGRWYSNPALATLRSLWRRDLIEADEQPFIGDSGRNYGHRLRLTPMGRNELREAAPRTFTSSWRTLIKEGRHPRKRTRQLKTGDLILMRWTDGSKEWRRITDIKQWLRSDPDSFEFTTDGSDAQRDGTATKTHNHFGGTRWTVQTTMTTEGN